MKDIGRLYCIDGNVWDPLSQTDYVVGYNDVNQGEVREDCKSHILCCFDKGKFEKQRGISIDKLVDDARLSIAYESCVPVSEESADYDIWGPSVCRLFPTDNRGATKVWVLSFIDDPLNLETKNE